MKFAMSHSFPGFRDRLDYHPGSGAQAIAPTARLNFCDLRCTVASINSTFTLSTEHISRGCDRDPEVMGERAKICGKQLICFLMSVSNHLGF